MFQLRRGDTVGIIALSNGLTEKQRHQIDELRKTLNQFNLNVVMADPVFRKDTVIHSTDIERANNLMNLFTDHTIKAIFDVSGGDLANGVLPYLNYELIKCHPKPFFGYSDLSVVVNGIYAKTKINTYLYQVKNLVGTHGKAQQEDFNQTLFEMKSALFDWDYQWIQGGSFSGVVVGGNIRCLLKLAGTSYIPNFKDKILFLEAMSGDVAKIMTYLNQLKQLGVFDVISGLVLGSFTELEHSQERPSIIELVQQVIQNDKLPIIKTSQIGHGPDSKCLIIGHNMCFNR